MTVDDAVEELMQWQRLGYGDAPVMLMNLNIGEHQEAEEINPISFSGMTPDQRSIEIR